MRRIFTWAIVSLILALVVSVTMGCQHRQDPMEGKLPPPDIQASFTVKSPFQGKDYQVGISRAALEKYFLLNSQARSAETAGTWLLFQPQIVYFKRSGSQMGLFEANIQRIYDDISSDRLLQTFQVTGEDENYVYFDWNYGLQAIVMKESPGFTDRETAAKLLQGRSPMLEVVASFVDQARFEGGQLAFRQMARVRQDVIRLRANPKSQASEGTLSREDLAVTLEIRIKPYVMNKSFARLKSQMKKGYGYFTTYTTFPGENEAVEIAQRWDLSPEKPLIKFRLSKRIPKSLIPSVIEGLDYWNRVVGRRILTVETDVDPQSTIDERTVMVHWVDWRDAGFAYAGYQADPYTGEIVQGQIFLTQFWEQHGKKVGDEAGMTQSLLLPGPQGSKFSYGCQYHSKALLSWDDGLPVNGVIPEEDPKSLVIRNVVAHEAGHIMGLRHNFAGSFYSKVTAQEIAESTRKYLRTGAIDELPTSTSMMDYPGRYDELFLAKYIRAETLEYDRAVIRWGYLDAGATEDLGFCTDEEAQKRKVIGCRAGDASANPVLSEILMKRVSREKGFWPDHQALVDLIFPSASEQRPMDDVLNGRLALTVTGPALSSLMAAVRLMGGKEPIQSVHRLKNWENPDRVKEIQNEVLEKMVSEVGLLSLFETAFPWDEKLDQPDLAFWDRHYQAMVTHPRFRAGTTSKGVPFQLSEAEADRLARFIQIKSADWAKTSLSSLSFVWPSETDEVVLAPSQTLKAEMPLVADRVVKLMRLAKGTKTFTVAGTVVEITERTFEPSLFSGWVHLFDPKYNKNVEPEARRDIARRLMEDFRPLLPLLGLTDLPDSVAEMRTKVEAIEAQWPEELRQWTKAETARIEIFEKK